MQIRTLLVFLSILIFHLQSYAQDTIVATNGGKYIVHFVGMTDDTLKYRTYTQPDGPIRAMAMNKVAQIRYKNGDIKKTENSPLEKEKEKEVEVKKESAILPGYDEIRPYLVDLDGEVSYYYEVGHHTDWYIAYSDKDNFTEIERKDAQAGCVSKKNEFYQFLLRKRVHVGHGQYELVKGDKEKYFVFLAENNKMILCKGLLDRPRQHRVVSGSVGSGHIWGTSSGDPDLEFYFYDGQNIEEINFTMEDVEQWKKSFTLCPNMVDAINQFTIIDNEDQEESIRKLLGDLAFIFQKNCYVQIHK